jgi:hypothetical protein
MHDILKELLLIIFFQKTNIIHNYQLSLFETVKINNKKRTIPCLKKQLKISGYIY